jgi:hypothetical protein
MQSWVDPQGERHSEELHNRTFLDCTSRRALGTMRGPGVSRNRSPDVLYARRGIDLQLSFPFAHQELDSCKIFLIDVNVLLKLCPRERFEVRSCFLQLYDVLVNVKMFVDSS